jgi:hypothetical protein
MVAATVEVVAAAIAAVVMGTAIISAGDIMVAAIFTADRPVHSPHTVHSLRHA